MPTPNDRCPTYRTVEDECAIMPFQCVLPAGHAGSHRATYPGQWGGADIPLVWSEAGGRITFERDRVISDAPEVKSDADE